MVELGRVLMSEEGQRSLCCGIGLWGPAAGYIKLDVHQAALRALRGSRCLNVVTKVSSVTEEPRPPPSAFGPDFLCPHEGKHVSASLHISVRVSFTLLLPGWIKDADIEMAKL